VRPEDVLPVRSRVSWGAIFAGATVALAVCFLLATFGTALGFTVAPRASDRELGVAAAIWSVLSVLISLFLGGFVAAQCAAGENRSEAVVYGLVLWGVLFTALLWLGSTGVSFGFNALVGVVNSPAVRTASDEELRQAGITPEQIERLRERLKNYPGELRQGGLDARTTEAAWWLFGGTALSMLAAILGALAGSGPRLVLRRVWVTRTGAVHATAGQAVPR
jgi:hypothetical protein